MVMIPVYMGEVQNRTNNGPLDFTSFENHTLRAGTGAGVKKALKEPAIACSLLENPLHRKNQRAGHYYRRLVGVSRVGDRDIE